MGTSLYNKIPLGRSSVFDSRPMQAALLVTGLVSVGLLWMLIRGLM